MIPLRAGGRGLRSVLCLGAHCDDIEIGCGATLRRLRRENPSTRMHWVVFSSNPTREAEARASAERVLGPDACAHRVDILRFRNGHFPYVGEELKQAFEALKGEASPDLILTHFRDDLHQDHRTVSELTWNTFRDHAILEYEIPKWDGGLGSPNVFVPASRHDAQLKARDLVECFPSEATKHWFSEDLFLGLMRIRGVECAAPDGYAEAFYARKLVVGF